MLTTLSRCTQAAFRNLRPAATQNLAGKRAASSSTQPPKDSSSLGQVYLRTSPNSVPYGQDQAWGIVKEVTDNKMTRTPEAVWASREPLLQNLPRPNGPYIGRSSPVTSQVPLSQALGKLRTIIRANNVTREVKLQARHEKKGYKRRRVESERWRRLFAHEVRMKVKIVQEIRARGA